MAVIAAHDITGLVLAGGQATRMGGIDKGLQLLNGLPLVAHVLQRLAPQTGPLLVNANRHVHTYGEIGAPFGARICPDESVAAWPEHPGPLAGIRTGLLHARTPWLLTCPCDAPFVPADLGTRLASALAHGNVRMAVAAVNGPHGSLQLQPVFCLLHASLRTDLEVCLSRGQSKVSAWARSLGCVAVPFDRPGDENAFVNVNTREELQALQTAETPHRPSAQPGR